MAVVDRTGAALVVLTIHIDGVFGPSEWGDADVAGRVLSPEGEYLWGHYSSSREYLIGDLTSNFGRALELADRYPNGYVVMLDGDEVARG
jgi:hypothetical protein